MNKIPIRGASLGFCVVCFIGLSSVPARAIMARNDNAYADYDNLDEAAAAVQRRTRGRVLSAREQNQAGEQHYEIKVLTPEGHVKEFEMPTPHTRRRYRDE